MSLVGWIVGSLVAAGLLFLAVTGWAIDQREKRIREREWWRSYVAERAREEQR